jgi:hypothetical protein
VPLKKITEWQRKEVTPFFFEGFITNVDGKRVPALDTLDVTIRNGGVEVLYSGDASKKLIDRIAGAVLPAQHWDIANPDKPIYYQGLGEATFWYKGADEETRYQLSSNTPVEHGTYDVFASFAEGENFEAVPSNASAVVYIGEVTIVPGTLESVFGFRDSEYDIPVKLEAKRAYNNVSVPLLSLLPHGAKYDDQNLNPVGSGSGALVEGSARIAPTASDSTLMFSVNNTSDYNQVMVFTIPVDPAYGENFEAGQSITVTVKFVTAAEMKEAKPEITVNYRDAKLTGLKAGAQYTINGAAVSPKSDTVAIAAEWEGTTLKIVKLPGSAYTLPSDTASVVIAARPEAASAAVLAVKGDSASTALAPDGRLSGTTAAMEYKLASATTWTRASDEVTRNLAVGTYNVRDAATATSFAGPAVTVTIYSKSVSVAGNDRVVPGKNGTEEAAVNPVAKLSAELAVGPNPVASSGSVKVFWSGSKQVKGTLAVFSSTGKKVAKVSVSGTKQVGVWNVANVPEGTYLLKGVLTSDGKKVKVSTPVAVVR